MKRVDKTWRIPFAALALILVAFGMTAGAQAKGKPKSKGKSSTTSVAVGDNFFKPKSVSISANSTVAWHWKGKAPHNVTVVTGPQKFHSDTQTKGSYSHKFTKKGSFSIVCTLHQNMTMKVSVH
jgi:plastocyanin